MARRPLEETKFLLLETGSGMLRARPDMSASSLKLIDVCRDAGLKTAGSGYKIWPNQDDFRTDLLRHQLRRSVASDDFLEIAKAVARGLASDDALHEAIRQLAAENASTIIDTPDYFVYVALWCEAAADDELAALLHASDEQALSDLEELYAIILEARGRELVPPFTVGHFATLLSALVEGLALRDRYSPGRVPTDIMRPTGPNGEEQPWHLFACGVDALFSTLTRPIADSQ